MKIERATFGKHLISWNSFHIIYIGSNADLPIVGGSGTQSHDHFRGHYEFAMAKAGRKRNLVQRDLRIKQALCKMADVRDPYQRGEKRASDRAGR